MSPLTTQISVLSTLFHSLQRAQLLQYLHRITKPTTQLDLQQALHTMHHLLILQPSRAFIWNRRVYHIKGHYYRDDPAFLVLFGWLVMCTAMGYIVAFGGVAEAPAGSRMLVLVLLSAWRYIRFCLWLLFVDYLLFGIVMATLGFFIGNYYLMRRDASGVRDTFGAATGTQGIQQRGFAQANTAQNRRSHSHPTLSPTFADDDNESSISSFTAFDDDSLLDDDILTSRGSVNSFHQHAPSLDWLYCFDVHLNAFFGLFCIIYVTQYLMLPLLLKEQFITIALGNTLYALGFVYYFIVTFHGYLELNFLQRAEVFLSPIAFVFVVWVLSIVFQVHVVSLVLSRWIG